MNFLTKGRAPARMVAPGAPNLGVGARVERVHAMHIPNAVLDPKVAAVTAAVGVAGLGYALRVLERRLGERTTVQMGTMSAFVFAAQMVNFPVGPGVSGHLLGGVLSAVLLGPWAGAVVVAAVLIVQCLLFGDGGLTALGANFVNMGLIGAVLGYAIYAPIRRAVGGRAGVVFGAMIAAWFSVLLASGAFAVELAASGRRGDFFRVLSWMVLVHSAIGLGEALITGLVVRFVLSVRPDLVYEPDNAPETGSVPRARTLGMMQAAVGGLAVALAVVVFLAPFASEHPDGLEFVGDKLGFLKGEAAPSLPVPMPDYRVVPAAGPEAGGHEPGPVALYLTTAGAGAIGTLVVFAVAAVSARLVAGSTPRKVAPDAA